MKTIQLEISLLDKNKKISRTILVPKKTTYQQLHEMIQLVFNLDHIEAFMFEKNKKVIENEQTNKTLIRLKQNDTFDYYYDLINMIHFRCVVKEIIDSDECRCIHVQGKNLYESVHAEVEDVYQSDVDLDWINTCLKAYQKDYEQSFKERLKSLLERLIKIRFFQDYMHNQIVCIDLPQNRSVFMGCDASEDVILNFHINANKLVEYTSVNPKAITQSIIKYHDCIELALVKRAKSDLDVDFDCTVGPFGVFFNYANIFEDEEVPSFFKEMYLVALEKYILVIEECAKKQIKFKYGRMMHIDQQNVVKQIDGKLNITNIDLVNETSYDQLKKVFEKRENTIEVDVLSLFEDSEVVTLAIIGNKTEGFSTEKIYNASTKSMLATILGMLIERWSHSGIDSIILMRDTNLYKEVNKICETMDIECQLVDNLIEMDDAFIQDEHVNFNELNPKDIVLRLLEELGVDTIKLQEREIKKEDLLEKIEHLKNDKKYS